MEVLFFDLSCNMFHNIILLVAIKGAILKAKCTVINITRMSLECHRPTTYSQINHEQPACFKFEGIRTHSY